MRNSMQGSTRNMVLTAIFLAIIMIQTVVPVLGFIPLGFMNATIIHVTVAIGAVLLGVKAGAGLGFAFGLASMWKNTILMPNVTSFCFSPFTPGVGGYMGGYRSVIVCMVPRILVGVVTALVYAGVKRTGYRKLALLVSGAAAGLTNTLLVMGGIYFLFGKHYAEATGRSMEQLPYIIMGIVGTQGLGETVISAVLTLAVAGGLLKVMDNTPSM